MKLTTDSPFGYVYGDPGDPQPEDIKVFYLPAVNPKFPFLVRRKWASIYIPEFYNAAGISERGWSPVRNREPSEIRMEFDPYHPKGHLYQEAGEFKPARIIHISTRTDIEFPIFAVVDDKVSSFDSEGYYFSKRSPTFRRLVNVP